MIARALALLLAAALAGASPAAQEPLPFTRTVFLMGTEASLTVLSAERAEGRAALERAIAVLEAAEDQLSTWRPDSDISRLNRQPVGVPWHASRPLCDMFARVDRWQRATGGAFDPAVGALIDAWDIQGSGRVPSAEALAAARARSGWPLFAFDGVRCRLTRTADARIDVGGFGKGEALDRVADALAGTVPWMIDLGGQISVGGLAHGKTWAVALAHPLERTRAALHLRLPDGSLSTSAGSERDLVVNGGRIGHILDPHTGQPAAFTGSATVWHRNGLTADALSTALYVMGPDRGLAWAAAHGISVCYLIPAADGALDVRMSPGFRPLVSEPG